MAVRVGIQKRGGERAIKLKEPELQESQVEVGQRSGPSENRTGKYQVEATVLW